MVWDPYFDETPPEEYRFLNFYKYRQKQNDFTFSFQKESRKLQLSLDSLSNSNSYSEDVKRKANAMRNCFEAIWEAPVVLRRDKTHTITNHRLCNKDVNKFWNEIELKYSNDELQHLELKKVLRTKRCHVDISSKTQDMMENMAEETVEQHFAMKSTTKKKGEPSSRKRNLTETDDSECFPSDDLDFSGSDRDEKESSNSPTSSDSNNQQKKRKINKGKQPIRMKRGRYNNISIQASSSNIETTPQEIQASSSNISNTETPPQEIQASITQVPRTPSPRPNVNNIQITPQKSTLSTKSVNYLQNHIEMNVNDQGAIIKENDTSGEISNSIRNWLVTVLLSSKEDFMKAIMSPLGTDASLEDHKFQGPLKRNIGERTYIVERIVPLIKSIQSIYKEYVFHWIEKELECIKEVKKLFPKFDLPINQADGLGVPREGGFGKADKGSYIWSCLPIANHLDKSVEEAKDLCTFTIQGIGDRLTLSKLCLINKHVYKVSQIKSATLPFEFIDVADFLAVFELIYILVSELEIQTKVINKLRLSKSVNGTTVPRIRDWIWLPDSVSAWECRDSK
ncbi:10951_t:CDS:10 [Diversispora eburnea]|uniref:10951_t:CDS:1 n=1 Tax=Diversispora eburnea TaxID=1213867 RepID=A0A9N9GEL9_9GLOM|nr:10951_t:CDS:10 [Diversispora eburnea]